MKDVVRTFVVPGAGGLVLGPFFFRRDLVDGYGHRWLFLEDARGRRFWRLASRCVETQLEMAL